MCPTQIRGEINKTYTGPSPPPPPHDCSGRGESPDQSEAGDGGGDQSEGRVSQHERSKDLLLWGEITKSRVNHGVTGSGRRLGETGACINMCDKNERNG